MFSRRTLPQHRRAELAASVPSHVLQSSARSGERCFRGRGIAALFNLALAALLGCSGVDQGSSCGRFVEGDVRVMAWLGGDFAAGENPCSDPQTAEDKALCEMEAAYHECNPSSEVQRLHVQSKRETDDLLVTKMSGADIVLTSGGRLVQMLCEDGALQTLEMFERQPDFYAQHVRDLISVKTQDEMFSEQERPKRTLCAVPMGQHQLNRLHVNLDNLPAALDQSRWTSLEAFLDDLEALEDPAPLFAIAAAEHWTLSLLAFENMMLAAAGSADYEDFWSGDALATQTVESESGQTVENVPIMEALIRTMEQMQRLRAFTDLETEALTEEQAWESFIHGDRAFYVMGNWREGDEEVMQSSNIISIDFPGTDSYYMFTLDVLVVPETAENVRGALGFARAATDPAVSGFYNSAKGSASVLASAEAYSRTDVKTYVPSLPTLLKHRELPELEERVAYWYRSGDSQQLIDYVAQEYCHLGDREVCPVVDPDTLTGAM